MRAKKNNDAKKQRMKEQRNARRFARHMENERIRHRMEFGDRWVAERMTKVTDMEDLAEEMRERIALWVMEEA